MSSNFVLNDKKFRNGIEGKPDPERMDRFREAVACTRQLAQDRRRTNPSDGEGLFALTLAAGMESDALSILEKKHLDALKRMEQKNAQDDEAFPEQAFVVGSSGLRRAR